MRATAARLTARDAPGNSPSRSRNIASIASLHASANRDFAGYEARSHGLGRVRAPAGAVGALDLGFDASSLFSPGNTSLAGSTRQAIEQRAYWLWASAGRPSGRDLEFWCRARAELGVPPWLS
jgi:hypothetical protein